MTGRAAGAPDGEAVASDPGRRRVPVHVGSAGILPVIRAGREGGQHMFRLLYFLAALTIAVAILITSLRERESAPDYQAYSTQDGTRAVETAK